MGREFLDIFTGWAKEYDQTVTGHDPEYEAVFHGYDELLTKMVALSGNSILEFGSGTGNLTIKFLNEGKVVFPVEPSQEMINIAKEKKELKHQFFIEGDLEDFPLPPSAIDTIAASFDFHHLTESEKQKVIRRYYELLPPKGKIIIGDTMFLSDKSYQAILNDAYETGKLTLVEDLEREYYPYIFDLETYFRETGFTTRFTQMNNFAWIVEATKN